MEHDLTTPEGIAAALLETRDDQTMAPDEAALALGHIIHDAATAIANERIAHLGGHLLSTYGVQVYGHRGRSVIGHLPPTIPENRPIDSLASLGGYILQEYGDGVPDVPEHDAPNTGEGDA